MTLRHARRSALALLAIGSLALLAVGSGSGAEEQRKRGGTLKLISSGDIDSADPAQTNYSFGWQILIAAHRPLYSTPASRTRPVPDLAAGKPQISADGKTVTVRIKRGIRYSPPLNREVTSADVKYAIERSLSTSVPSGEAPPAFADLVGAPEKPPKTPKPISGLRTPDRYTLVFRLKQRSPLFLNALELLNTAPIPRDYAAKYDDKASSDYAFFQVASGPYMFENDSSGNIKNRGYTPGKRIKLVRNPNWSSRTDHRPAYVDTIELDQGYDDDTVAMRLILSGRADFAGDIQPPPAIVRQLQSTAGYKDNWYTVSSGTQFIAINTKKKPFDNLNVRRALNFVLDKHALRLAEGGEITGTIATHFIGPQFRGYGFEAAGAFSFDPFRSPGHRGSVAKAKAELRKAGFANGMYSGPAVTLMNGRSSITQAQSRIVAASLAKIGVEVNIRLVSWDALFSKYCTAPKNQPELCGPFSLLSSVKEPVDLLTTFDGSTILPTNNFNLSQLNDPKINLAIGRAKRTQAERARYAAWGRIDRMATESAAVIPVKWPKWVNVVSDRIVPGKQLWNAGVLDLSATSIK
jgi:peptide/nickel transport system substrate-binding protein